MTTRNQRFGDLAGYTPLAPASAPQSEQCPTCGAHLVYTTDAIGRLRARCPVCQGVSKKTPPHPDQALVPQTLVPAAWFAPPAPPPLPPPVIGEPCPHCGCRVRARKVKARPSLAKPAHCVECGAEIPLRPSRKGVKPRRCADCDPRAAKKRDRENRWYQRRRAPSAHPAGAVA